MTQYFSFIFLTFNQIIKQGQSQYYILPINNLNKTITKNRYMRRSQNIIQKQQYLFELLKVLEQFEYTHSPQVLHSYAKKNRDRLKFHVQSLMNKQNTGQHKSNSYLSSELNIPILSRQQSQIAKLEKQYEKELLLSKDSNKEMIEQHVIEKEREFDQILINLNQNYSKLVQSSRKLVEQVQKQRFYKQWDIMDKEYKGANALNLKLQKQLERRKQLINEAKKNKK